MNRIALMITICTFASFSLEAQTTEFEQIIQDLGLTDIQYDWSTDKKVVIPEPNCAYVNITGISSMPEKKNVNLQAWMEFYDGAGSYFKKHVILNAQGNSSLNYVKKNIALDLLEDEWIGETETKMTIGDWVTQDSYHLKAYYLDYFRGTSAVGYKLYHQIASDRGLPWTRSNLSKPNKAARCYPDGFPCVVYLNGEFYGVFSWQLKKNRDNYNLKKNIATHIHLDGKLGSETFWGDTIDWTQFEVRNPKKLYTMEGEEYDEDVPVELIDEASETFNVDGKDDEVKTNKELTASVKATIIQLSKRGKELAALEAEGASAAEMREHISRYFDVGSLIDYLCFHLAVANFDGFAKNWQWFTYDGEKWFVAPYDLDCIMGNHYSGNILIPARYTGVTGTYKNIPSNGPMVWIRKYYMTEIKERWCDLAEKQILSADNIKSLVEDWYYRVGNYNYSKEWKKWQESPCINETMTNENWLATDDYTDYSKIPDYDKKKTYEIGDKCKSKYRIWIATGTIQGVTPYTRLGFQGSLESQLSWIDERIELENAYTLYFNEEDLASYTLHISSSEWTTICVPFSYKIPENLIVYSVTGLKENGSMLVQEVVNGITEANKPYLVCGPAGYYHLNGVKRLVDDGSDMFLQNGLLCGTYEAITVPMNNYVLQNHNGKTSFSRVNDDVILQPNKAYLSVPKDFAWTDDIEIDDTTDDINCNTASPSNHTIYNINGNQLTHPIHGVNILRHKDGSYKKIIMKQ